MNCKEVVLSISSGQVNESWRGKIAVKFHLLMCQHCSRYSRHIEMLGEGVKKIFETKGNGGSDVRIKETEDKVIEEVLKEIEKP